MSHFFCANLSRESGEDIIGSAPGHSTYIAIECPQPWAAKALESKGIPENLRALAEKTRQSKQSVRFILITSNRTASSSGTKVILCRKKEGLADGYYKREFETSKIEEVAPILENYLAGEESGAEWVESLSKDILVCTHGSHDKCCAKYGYPFFREARAIASEMDLRNVRVWEASHIGGHRFAPTFLSLPDGRYYGAVDGESFKSILLRKGDIRCFNRVYRGWGLLPMPIQVLEQELILQKGWEWFNYKVYCKILAETYNRTLTKVELFCKPPSGTPLIYRADIVLDESRTLHFKGSCNSEKESTYFKFAVENLHLVEMSPVLDAVG